MFENWLNWTISSQASIRGRFKDYYVGSSEPKCENIVKNFKKVVMGKVKYNEVEYKKEVEKIYGKNLEVVSRYKGLDKPILVKDQYGIMRLPNARQVLNNRPTIKMALNKTEYFMNQLREAHPEIAKQITPVSEYEAMKKKMLFDTKYGLVSMTPDGLIHGSAPMAKSAVDRKDYMRKQLLDLYDNQYDFIITSTDRHQGRNILVCPIHGKVSIDSCHIFSGCGCPKCNHGWTKSDHLYIVRLYSKDESFYKLGITGLKNGKPRRYKDYEKLGYCIEEIKLLKFESWEVCRDKETELKRIIKNHLYTPKHWEWKTSKECFKGDLLEIIIKEL